ncbi:3-deoxy-manno-octulosonate cytidylyltransferase [Actinacidiphila bryophytorum]|uniref:3-deoxy-manno-octulosonate cytidylyltransferase n=1 Tax=Actinacidiphila bryophytorum TaxID=1436133 RepID=A0A9W4MJG5_9ACTN|nr:3-deoxy-manno-octulosonate cytidylyltransferase [Actinacidiphila bryophytorum]MBM9437256.1 3-deoxy-manno-octulosonate cytidylyltransferase [Actinacidiphila bryophytorum]MBN6541776.1 3-deoxy-manno-octulosonate cytidylyltransferase [Actinacidiphila bryophytorum]CAG7651290.1 3-deoxy-manno-octulosonate cytidylyltransferase [Actinacidiphila bryophytorum]
MAKEQRAPSRPRHIAVIPCRWGASRFPGKPLALLGEKPLFWHVYQRCLEASTLAEVVVATDDDRIRAACDDLGIRSVMTGEHPTGTDRVAECARHLDADAFINVQGDEPFISPAAIDAVSSALTESPSDVVAVNACTELRNPAAVLDHNVVKAVTAASGNALMPSRQPIPYPRGAYPTYLRQLGLYGFTPAALRAFRTLKQGPLEQAEGVEMMRFIEHGYAVRAVLVDDHGVAVDTPEDLRRAAARMKGARRSAAPLP